MENVQTMETGTKAPNILYRFLHLFTAIYPGETTKAFLLTLNSFLIMFGYYQIKAIRNGLLLARHPSEIQSYLAIPQAFILIFVVKAFAKIASRYPRHILITYVTLFCISNLIIFNIMNWAGVSVAIMGIVFFIWIGMYNLLIPAQFWGFANDIYSEEEGKRLFPMIAFGASLGAVLGPPVAQKLVPHFGSYGMMLVTSGILVLCILMTWIIHKRDLREERQFLNSPGVAGQPKPKVKEQPLDKSGGFRLIFKSRYLLLIALVIGLYNFINALGEQMFAKIQQQVALRTLETAATGSADLQNYISQAFAGYQGLANILGLLIQLFLVSRIFRYVGVGGALLFLPVIALGGYGYAAFGASLLLMKWVKSVENGTDYSLMKTAKSALFLITKREEKYKAQAAIETFFVRGGDTLCAVVVWVGTTFLALSIERFAVINVVSILIWIFLTILIIREYKKKKAQSAADPSA
ncbi:MAG: MFS transporter [Candidatus Aminicenantes bacterium]|nr:MFS transporter [Candidatus Aminicenantes bacterium]